jgi:hypothetical protein
MATSKDNAVAIRKTLDNARAGRATLVELAQAHDLAASLKLGGCLTELRQHIAAQVAPAVAPARSRPSDLVGDVVAGIISGALTHKLLG